MPQYQRCVKLLESQMKQVAAYIVARGKLRFMIKLLTRYEHESFYILKNSLSTDLKHKAQKMSIIVRLNNDNEENKSSHKHSTRESIDVFWVKYNMTCLSLKQSKMKSIVISQIMRKLKNILKIIK